MCKAVRRSLCGVALTAIISLSLTLGALTACGDTKSEDNSSNTVKETTTATTSTADNTESSDSVKETETSKEEESKAENSDGRVVLDVKHIYMLPDWPSGDEFISTCMVLNYCGDSCSLEDLYLTLPISTGSDQGVWWYSPWDMYLGSPMTSTASYGAYSPVIKKSIEDYSNYSSINYEVTDLLGKEPEELYKEIDAGNPVIVWATTGMKPAKKGDSWKLEDGSTFTWLDGTHCFVLIGYDKDKDTVILDDPADKKGIVEYARKDFEKRYAELHKQALVIHKK